MARLKSEFLSILSERGFIHQISDSEKLDNLLKNQIVSAYIGFDCTAPSLHVGSLIQIMLLYWFQQCGHQPIVLMGGGTSQVGDPSGKEDTRQLLTLDTIEENKSGIRRIFDHVLTFGNGPTDAIMLDNAEWLSQLNYVEFLRKIGRQFSVNQMLQRDAVKLRLEREQNLSFLEFNYMILQAFDFAELNKRQNVRLQMGGSDQWGNIVSGIDLGRRLNDIELYGLTTPLLETSSGAKMGKTASGAVWLDSNLLSAYDYWQFWRNTEDADVSRFLKLFTTLPLGEISRLSTLQGAEINDAKKILATEATKFVHGETVAKQAEVTSRTTFEDAKIATDLPTINVEQSELEQGIGILELFVLAGLCSSNSDTRRNIKSGAIRINDQPIKDERYSVKIIDLTSEGVIKLSLGKKKHVLVKPN